MKKYIIENCPARLPKSGFCIEAPKKKAYLCQNCTNCVVKQTIEICLDYPNQCKIEGNCIDDRTCTSCFLGGGCELAQDILELFHIREVEDE